MRRVIHTSISSEFLMCGGGERIILVLLLVARCLDTIDVCIWRRFVFMSVYLKIQIALIFDRVWSEQGESCFV